MKKCFTGIFLAAILLFTAACSAGAGGEMMQGSTEEEISQTESTSQTESISQSESRHDTNGKVLYTEIPEGMIQGINNTGKLLMEKLYKENKNIFISPLSIYLDFGILYSGTEGETKKALAEFFGYDEDISKEAENIDLLTRYMLDGNPGVRFNMANSIWLNNIIAGGIKESFKGLWAGQGADIFTEDFSDAGIKDKINGWVSDKTEGMIPDIVDSVPPGAMLYLINAIYFKGDWAIPFNKENTYKDTFHSPEKDMEIDFMSISDGFGYIHKDSFDAVRLNYADGRTSMYLVLPAEGSSPEEMAAHMSDIAEEMDNGSFGECSIQIPKPDISYSISDELVGILKENGLDIIFRDDADLSGIAEGGLKVGSVVHKTALKVDEAGTEASAATSIEIVETAMPEEPEEPFVFKADRPYYMLIADDTTGMVIFEGYIQNPEK